MCAPFRGESLGGGFAGGFVGTICDSMAGAPVEVDKYMRWKATDGKLGIKRKRRHEHVGEHRHLQSGLELPCTVV